MGEDVVPPMVTPSVKVVHIAQSGTGVVTQNYTSQLNNQSFPMVEHARNQKLLLTNQLKSPKAKSMIKKSVKVGGRGSLPPMKLPKLKAPKAKKIMIKKSVKLGGKSSLPPMKKPVAKCNLSKNGRCGTAY